MIEVTDEMVAASLDGGDVYIDAGDIREGLAAVLALVERDHLQPTAESPRCSDCGRTARELRPWHETVGGRRMVVARLGPTCWRKRMDTGGGRQALPIGGGR
ncbi:hypothetical protein ACTOB_001380 [Actinoplanes oblitus]|uniref:Uncharacterized protein n=1 Tax=Actinoplanes oblitus TaxID=3040509 RepID=A0ABY8WIX9_9ACTN|nr:hypothetical protein [Actinoplanes oblitus]WIM97826.1 hypothetical protein ACTOB_001380 [Actinoplanes oblitus]